MIRAPLDRPLDRTIRWQAVGHPLPRLLLAGRVRAPGAGPVHRPDRLPRHKEGGPQGRAPPPLRRLLPAGPVPGGGAARSRHLHWASDLLGIPVIDHWWQTETGWPIAANCLGLEPLAVKPGSPTKPVPGYDVR